MSGLAARPAASARDPRPFVVDPQGVVEDTFADLRRSATASRHEPGPSAGDVLFFAKDDVAPGAAEWWVLRGNRAWHLFDSSRGGPDKGWYLRDGAWFARRVHTGLVERFADAMTDLNTGRSRPFVYTLSYEVSTDGRWRVLYDPRDEKPAGERRPGRAERFTFESRWSRWTDLWDNPDVPGHDLEVVRDTDGHLRDYALPEPQPAAFAPCPRPGGGPVKVTVKAWGPQQPQPAPVTAWIDVALSGEPLCVALEVGGHEHHRVEAPAAELRLESQPLGEGAHRLRVRAEGAGGTDITGLPRIVTVLAAPVQPPPPPQPPIPEPPPPDPVRPPDPAQPSVHVTHIRGRRNRFWRVTPEGVVDVHGEAANAWERVRLERHGEHWAFRSLSDRTEVANAYLRFDEGVVRADRTAPGPTELVRRHVQPGGGERYETLTGHWLAEEEDGRLTCVRKVGEPHDDQVWPGPGPFETFTLDPPLVVAPPVEPLRGALSVAGRFFQAGGRDYRPAWASCLSALRPGHDYRPALDGLVALGFGGVRVFAGALPWAGQAADDALRRLPDFLDDCGSRGLYAEVTALTETGTGYDKARHAAAVAQICAGRDGVVLEWANEPWHPTQRDLSAAFLGQLRTATGTRCLVALGADRSDESPGYAAGDYVTAHLDRSRDKWNMVRRVRELEALSAASRKPVLNNEPIGAAEQGKPGSRESDPAIFFAMGALDRLFEVGGVFHSEDGLHARPLGPNQTRCAELFVQGSRIWPGDARLTYLNTGHTGSPVARADLDEPARGYQGSAIRAYSGVTGSAGFTIVVGLRRNDGGIVWGSGWQPVGELARYPGVAVFKVARS